MEKETIITAVIVGVLMFIRDWIKDYRDKIAAKKLATVHKNELENNSTKHSLEFLEKIDREVKHEIRKIRDRHQAMRVYVMMFSNGTVTHEIGLPLVKITFMHEILLDWQVEPIQAHFQEYPMPQMFASAFRHVVQIGQYYLKNRDELNLNDPAQREYNDWLKAYKVNSTMWIPIRKNGNIAAILVSHWPAQTDLDGAIIAKIKDICRDVETIYARL